MIYNCGIDIVEISRIKRLLSNKDNVLSMLFNDTEKVLFGNPPYSLGSYTKIASFFCLKEAVLKCCGIGWQEGVSWKDVEINCVNGYYTVNVIGKLKTFISEKGVFKIVVNADADRYYAVSYAVALKSSSL